MDNFFKATNPIFVGFCALLVVSVFAAGYIRDQRILEEAKVIGRQEAEWSWPSQGISTNVDNIEAKILKRTENDAEVEVRGKQKIILQTPEPDNQAKTSTNAQAVAGPESGSHSTNSSSHASSVSDSEFKAVVTLYKHGNSRIWWIGKVEGR
jgi:hypothetical protein